MTFMRMPFGVAILALMVCVVTWQIASAQTEDAPEGAEESVAELSAPDGPSTAEGELKDGLRHGEWFFEWADGRSAWGPYKEGNKHGRWNERWADGRVFVGSYKEGLRHGNWTLNPLGKGEGSWKYRYDIFDPGATVMERLYLNGQPLGSWKLYYGYVVGEGYSVDQDGQLQGEWEFHWSYGRRETSIWVDGVRDGGARIVWADGSSEVGDYRNGRRSGYWLIRWSGGPREEGRYRNGQRSGLWRIEYADGQADVGEYKAGVRSGKWTVYWPHGAVGTISYSTDGKPQLTAVKGEKSARGGFEKNRNPGVDTYLKKGLWKVSSKVFLRYRSSRGVDFIRVLFPNRRSRGSDPVYLTCGNRKTIPYCKGRYSNDERVGEWVFRYASGAYKKANYWRGEETGHVEIRYADGDIKRGRRENGEWQGTTVRRLPSGDRAYFPYRGGKYNGVARQVYPSGNVMEKVFSRGEITRDWKLRVAPRRIVKVPKR